MNRYGGPIVLLCALLFAAACGGSSGEGSPAGAGPSSAPGSASGSASPAASPSGSDGAGSADAAFCTGFDKNGGSPASLGEPPLFYAKDQLVSYAQETLGVMKGLTPPAEIAAAWTTYAQFQTRLLAAAQALGAGQRLSAAVPGQAATTPAYTKINAWISANC